MRLWPLALLVPLLVPGCGSTPEAHSPADTPTVMRSAPAPDAPHAASAAHPAVGTNPGHAGQGTTLAAAPGHQLAMFAAGCFWGVEARFRRVPGVVSTAVGYTGGHTERPTYEQVCTHTTGHAEAVLLEFDPALVSYEALLDVFWASHDPTQVDRQGPDVGDQYRSAVFTFSDAQQATVRTSMTTWQKRMTKPIATRVTAVAPFYLAEDYHQQYHEKTGSEACPSGQPPLGDTI